MVSFLAPWLLWTLPGAAAPVVLHLLFLRRARRVRFGDLTLLEKAYSRSLPSSRLRQWLLLAARCLLLAFLVLAFARPVLQSAGRPAAGAGREGLRLVVLVDTSYSMRYRINGRTRFESAVAAGRQVLGALGPQDRAAVLGFSARADLPPPAAAWPSDPAAAAAALGRLEPGFGVTDYLPALAKAYELLARAPQGDRRAILVLSDNAAHGLRVDASLWKEKTPGFDPSVALLGLGWPDVPDNASIASAEPGPSPNGPQSEPALTVRVDLSGPPRADWELSLWQDGRREAQKRLALSPGRPAATAAFALRPEGPASSGKVELRADGLAEDDAYYYSLWAQPRPKVLLAYGGSRSMQAGRGAYFLRKIFIDPKGSLLPYRFEIADSVLLASLPLQDFQAVVLIDFKSVPRELGASLERYVRGGGGLWMIGAAWDGPESYRSLAGVLPARWIEPLEFPAANGLAAEPSAAQAGERFSWKDFDLRGVSVRRGYLLAPEPGSRVWLRDAGSRPMLVSGSAGAGRTLVWGSSLDMDWTNLALKPVFAPWVDWSLGRLTGFSDRREWRTVLVGGKFSRVWRPEEPAPASVRVVGPNRRAVSVRVEGRRMEYEAALPGLYAVESPSGTDVFAANLDRSSGESDLAPMASPPWRLLSSESPRQDFQRFLYGREARGQCLALALGLLLGEMLLAAPRLRLWAAVLFLLAAAPAGAQEGDKFAWTQLRYAGAWDPYPDAHAEVLQSLTRATSVLAAGERKVIGLDDPALFSSPFTVLTGRQAPPSLGDRDLRRLRDYLVSGGFLWIEDASGLRASAFDRWVRQTLKLAFPDSGLAPLGGDHVVFKTFFLLRAVGGRVLVEPSIEGVEWGGRTVVIYSRNDILGALAKDALGRPLYPCSPGGELQRRNAQKLALNIVMYSLTGNYKADAVHQPYLLQKMRAAGAP